MNDINFSSFDDETVLVDPEKVSSYLGFERSLYFDKMTTGSKSAAESLLHTAAAS